MLRALPLCLPLQDESLYVFPEQNHNANQNCMLIVNHLWQYWSWQKLEFLSSLTHIWFILHSSVEHKIYFEEHCSPNYIGAPWIQLHGQTHFFKYFILCSTEQRISNSFETIWGSVNYDRTFIFGRFSISLTSHYRNRIEKYASTFKCSNKKERKCSV